MSKKNYDKWVCTDSDTQQYGRQINETTFQFKEKGKDKSIVDIKKYSNEQIENIINSYGYTLEPNHRTNNNQNIHVLYGEEANWIIAECIFESE